LKKIVSSFFYLDKQEKEKLQKLKKYYHISPAVIIIISFIVLLQGFIILFIPSSINNIYDYGFISKDLSKFYRTVVLLLSIYFFLFFSDIFIEKTLNKNFIIKPSKIIRNELFENYIQMPIDFYYDNGPAGIARNLSGNLNNAISSTYNLLKIYISLIKTIVYLISIILINPLYSLFIILSDFFIIFINNIIERKKVSILSNQNEAFMNTYDKVYDNLEGEYEIYANNIFKYFTTNIKKPIENLTMNFLAKVDHLTVFSFFVKNSYKKLVPVILLFILYFSGLDNNSISSFFSLYFLFLIFPDISSIAALKLEIKKVEARWKSIISIFEKDKEKNGKNINENFDIKINNLSIKLRDREILKNLSLEIPFGQKILIVGRSGEGKSVLMNSLFGSFYNGSGKIFIGNILMEDLNIENFRNNISYINSNPIIFKDSIYNNIKLSKEISNKDIDDYIYKNITLDEIQEIERKDMPLSDTITEFKINDFFIRFSDLNQIITTDTLSSGEKIIISFLRAIIRKPKILFLDEATGSLDKRLESKMLSIIKNMDITVIAISHNLSVIKYFDRIIYLNSGEIKEEIVSEDFVKSKYIKLLFEDQVKSKI
jgi:ABC-type multidrug transport system fused ATPase/permease subunit